MDERTASQRDRASASPQESDGLWSEALSALGLFGAVLVIVLVVSLVGRV